MSAEVSERGGGRCFRLRLPATPASAAIFRGTLREWLQGVCVQPADILDVVLACSEALSLVIEERPRRASLVVEVTADTDGDRLTVTTRDYGLCHESYAHRQEEQLSLYLMRVLVDSVELERHPDGQTVTLVKRVGGLESVGARA